MQNMILSKMVGKYMKNMLIVLIMLTISFYLLLGYRFLWVLLSGSFLQ